MATDINPVDIARSIYDQFNHDSMTLWQQLVPVNPSQKNRIVIAFGLLAQQHCRSSALLAEAGCMSSARALVRSATEACGRAMLIAYKKNDQWAEDAFAALKHMQERADNGQYEGIYDAEKESVPLPTLAKLINELRDIPDEKSFEMFEKITKSIVPMLNSFTHGGIGSIGRMINEHSIEEPDDPAESSRLILAMATLDCFVLTALLRVFEFGDDAFVVQRTLRKAMDDHGFKIS